MKMGPRVIMLLILLFIACWVVMTAVKWPLAAGLFPLIVGMSVLVIGLFEIVLLQLESKKSKGVGAYEPYEETGSDGKMQQQLPVHSLIVACAWILGFYFLIILFSFPIAVPIFVFIYLKVYGRERWNISLGLTAFVSICFYLLFVRLVNVQFMDGWLQRLLGIV